MTRGDGEGPARSAPLPDAGEVGGVEWLEDDLRTALEMARKRAEGLRSELFDRGDELGGYFVRIVVVLRRRCVRLAWGPDRARTWRSRSSR